MFIQQVQTCISFFYDILVLVILDFHDFLLTVCGSKKEEGYSVAVFHYSRPLAASRRTSVGASTAQAKHIAFQETASVECGEGPMAETLFKFGHKTNIAKMFEKSWNQINDIANQLALLYKNSI